jgi:hypothetical protein
MSGMREIDRLLASHVDAEGLGHLVVRGVGVDLGLAGFGITLCGTFIDMQSEPAAGDAIGTCWHCESVYLEREAWRAEQGL